MKGNTHTTHIYIHIPHTHTSHTMHIHMHTHMHIHTCTHFAHSLKPGLRKVMRMGKSVDSKGQQFKNELAIINGGCPEGGPRHPFPNKQNRIL